MTVAAPSNVAGRASVEPEASTDARTPKWRDWFLKVALPPLVAAVLILVTWQFYVTVTQMSRSVLPSPLNVIEAGLDNADEIALHVIPTLQATMIGLLLSIAASWVIASICDLSPLLRRAIEPLLIAAQTIPIVAIAPILVLWFGFSLFPKVLLVALTTFFPIVISLLQGMGSTSPDATRLYRSMGAGRFQRFIRLRVATALPYFFTGLKISIVYAVIGAIFGEYVGAQYGLGILMQLAKNARRTDLLLAAVAVSALVSLVLYFVVVVVERAVMPWQRFVEQGVDR